MGIPIAFLYIKYKWIKRLNYKTNKNMNWKELKEFANSLDEKQLEKNVVLWREDEAVNDINAENLIEDQYIGDDDEGCYSLSDAGLTIDDVKEKGLRKVYDQDSPILLEIF